MGFFLNSNVNTISIQAARKIRSEIVPHSRRLRSVSSSAAHICAPCRSACPSCGSDSWRRYRSSFYKDRERRRRISSSSSSGGRQWRPPTETGRRVQLAGVRPRCICSKGMSFWNIFFAKRETEFPLHPRRAHTCPQLAGLFLPAAWAWWLDCRSF